MIVKDIFVPDTNSSASQWMAYHSQLSSEFGEKEARTIFLMTFDKNAGDALAYDQALRIYLEEYDIDISSGLSAITANIYDAGSGAINGVGKVLQFLKYTIYGIGTIAIVAGVAIIVHPRLLKK